MYCWNDKCLEYNVPKRVTPQTIDGLMVCELCYQSVGVNPHQLYAPHIKKVERNLIEEYQLLQKIKETNG